MSVSFSPSSNTIRLCKILLQIGLLISFWWIGSIIQQILHAPISGSVIGLFLVLLGLLSGIFKLEWIKLGSDFILGELVLFFIPCFVGLIKYQHLFATEGWQLIASVTLGTVCVMIVTAFSVHLGFKIEEKIKAHHVVTKHISQGGK